MHVGVGYCENPDTLTAGREAAREALHGLAGANCDLVLLFSTSRHDAARLRSAVAEVIGAAVPIVGGGCAGAISNDRFGYDGDQVILAACSLKGAACELTCEGNIVEREFEAGVSLGKHLAEAGVTPESSVLLFYDAIDRSLGAPRLVQATPLLAGIEQALGFNAPIVGAGLQGDYIASPTKQWTGQGLDQHTALALSFSGDVRVDSVIMHGCRPATGYYTVTKAEGQVILEINNEPAIAFLDKLLGPAIKPKDYPFFLVLGINKGDKWGEFDEEIYINHLCLALDEERGGIVMFESDMVSGTEFQIMYRTLEPHYMPARMEKLFADLKRREPVFALYINCAGRAAGAGGQDIEDALTVQETVAGRVPLLGLYTGVEIAPVQGKSRGLDWTGVFCLFSVPAKGGNE